MTCDKTTNLKQNFFLWLTSDSSALHMYELVPRFLTWPSFFGLPCERNRDSSVKPPKVRGITGITLLPAGIGTLAPAQDLPKFQMLCLTPKSVQTCSIHSPDGDRKVSLKKIDPFMTNGCHIVAPPDVTSD